MATKKELSLNPAEIASSLYKHFRLVDKEKLELLKKAKTLMQISNSIMNVHRIQLSVHKLTKGTGRVKGLLT